MLAAQLPGERESGQDEEGDGARKESIHERWFLTRDPLSADRLRDAGRPSSKYSPVQELRTASPTGPP